MTSEELKDLDIHDWADFGANFEGADILLGNGFSLNLSRGFGYDSLFEEFLASCDTHERQIFESFGTTNFERIQQILLDAKMVNTTFGLPTHDIEDAIDDLKHGLISTVEKNHPRSSDIDWDQLQRISVNLDLFSDIFTTSYDLYLYHIILISKDRYRAGVESAPYNDYFWRQHDSGLLQFMDFQNYKHYDHIYYLHGALFIVNHPYLTLKLKRGRNQELVESIAAAIERDQFPLFVSEGTPEDKLREIAGSTYLTFALSKLKSCRKKLVMYGAGLSEQDQHIVDALGRKKRSIAYSVYVDGKSDTDLKSELHKVRSKLAMHDIVFFDSRTLFDF